MKFTDSHEWIEMESPTRVVMGVTTYAQKELGDIVYVELPTVGKPVNAGQEIAVLESTKAAADVYSPVSGTVVEVNEQLKANSQLVNASAESEGWICKIDLSNPAEMDLLMDQAAYKALVG